MSDPKDGFILQHAGYAEAIARKIAKSLPHWVPFDDLRQAALVGLCEAWSRFDPQQNAAFTTFAHARIRGEVWDTVRRMRDIPPQLRNEARRQALYAAAIGDVSAALERTGGNAALLEECVARAIDVAGSVVLLADLARDDGDADGAVPDRAVEPEPSELEGREVTAVVRAAIARLPERLRVVVEAIVLGGQRQVDIAAARGCDKAVINRLWMEAIRQLQPVLARALGERGAEERKTMKRELIAG